MNRSILPLIASCMAVYDSAMTVVQKVSVAETTPFFKHYLGISSFFNDMLKENKMHE